MICFSLSLQAAELRCFFRTKGTRVVPIASWEALDAHVCRLVVRFRPRLVRRDLVTRRLCCRLGIQLKPAITKSAGKAQNFALAGISLARECGRKDMEFTKNTFYFQKSVSLLWRALPCSNFMPLDRESRLPRHKVRPMHWSVTAALRCHQYRHQVRLQANLLPAPLDQRGSAQNRGQRAARNAEFFGDVHFFPALFHLTDDCSLIFQRDELPLFRWRRHLRRQRNRTKQSQHTVHVAPSDQANAPQMAPHTRPCARKADKAKHRAKPTNETP